MRDYGCIDDENWKTKADIMMIKTLGRRHLVFVIYCGVGTAANSGAQKSKVLYVSEGQGHGHG